MKNIIGIIMAAVMILSCISFAYADNENVISCDDIVVSGSAVEIEKNASDLYDEPIKNNGLWEYSVNIDGIYIYKYLGTDEEVKIPDSIDGLPVVQIGRYTSYSGSHNNVFENITIKNVVLPNTVKTICSEAFAGTTTLRSIYIPEGVREIGSRAFEGCTSLTSIEIPSTVMSYDYGENFKNCISLTDVTINTGADLPYDIFRDCTGLQNVNFIKPISVIGAGAFSGCTSLNEIELKEGLSVLNDNAFSNTALKSVRFPSTLKTLGGYSFGNCHSLTNVFINNGIADMGEAFYDCDMLEEVNIPDSLTEIKPFTFFNCSNLKDIAMGRGIVSIGNNAFSGCISLEKVEFDSNLTKIGYSAFDNCTGLETVILPENIKTIENGAFTNSGVKRAVFTGPVPINFGEYVFEKNPYMDLQETTIFYKSGTDWTEGAYNGYKCYPYPTVNEMVEIEDCDRLGFIVNINDTDIAYTKGTLMVWSNTGGKDDAEEITVSIEYDPENHISSIVPINIDTAKHNNETGLYTVEFCYGTGSRKTSVIKSVSVNVPTVSNKVEFEIPNSSVTTDGTVKIPIKITNNPGFSTFGIIVNYDSSLLVPLSVENGKIWGSNFAGNPDYEPGQISINGMDIKNVTTTGDLCYITFKVNDSVKENVSTELSITVNELFRYDGNYASLPMRSIVTKGIVDIQNVVEGDINFDGHITAMDATQALLCGLGVKNLTGTAFNAADTNKDGIITPIDATNILLKATRLK